jgi:hypothetical protein
MTRYKFSCIDLPDSLDPDELKLNGGFELADVERARHDLKKTQKELAGIKLNSRPATLKEARLSLKRTQAWLAQKGANP